MLAREPAGYRFTAKALQHALPDAKIRGGDVATREREIDVKLWLSWHAARIGRTVNTVVDVRLRLTAAGLIEVAEASVDQVRSKEFARRASSRNRLSIRRLPVRIGGEGDDRMKQYLLSIYQPDGPPPPLKSCRR